MIAVLIFLLECFYMPNLQMRRDLTRINELSFYRKNI